MSTSEPKDQTTEEIEANPPNKSEKVTERCGTARTSKLPTHARSLSISGLRSKIPTNIGHSMRSGSTVQSHAQPVSSDDGTIGKASSTNSGGLPTSKSLTVASSPSVVTKTNKSSSNSTGNSTMHNRYLENQFSTKKKRYVNLRKELTEKQKNVSELYIEMTQIREKLIAKGGRDPGKVETLNFTSVGIEHLPTSVSSEGRHLDGSGEHTSGPNASLTNEFITAAISKIRELPKRFFDLCSNMLRQRSEIMQSLIKVQSLKDKVEIEAAIGKEVESLKNETITLESRVEEAQKVNETSIAEMIEKISTLWNELESSTEKNVQLENNNAEFHKEISIKLDNAMKEKKVAEVECGRLRERELSLESELQKLRTKSRETETRISEADQKIGRLQNHIKNLENQLKQKDSNADKQLKDLEKSLKNSQSLLSKTEKQRDCLESKLVELKKQLGSKEKESENKIKQISNKLAAVNLELAKLREERSDVTTEKNGSSVTTDRRLAECDKRIRTLQRQKQEIIRAVDPSFFGEKCDLELSDDNETHSEIVGLLKKSIEELRLNSEKQQEKIENLQQQLGEFQSDGHAYLKYSDKPFTAHRIKDLEKQVNELRLSLKEVSHRNEQLELELNQKQLDIEKQNRIIKERSNVMKVRDEVIDLITENTKLRDKSLDSHRSLMKKGRHCREREQVDRQIAEKTENLQELYSTLESKQMQVTRLEQLVEQMEIQQERAQEQRTRLEKKIAQLQLAMHYRKGHRSRGWLSIL